MLISMRQKQAYIYFRKETSKRLILNVSTKTDFKEIFKIFNSIEFPGTKIHSDQVIFSILELINNSLRAHRECNSSENINIHFEIRNPELHIRVQDWGGGFDIKDLPYDLSKKAEEIDTNDQTFHEYREKNDYLRFGMGLYVAKKTFSSINLSFWDIEKRTVSWDSGKTAGTCIDLIIGDVYA